MNRKALVHWGHNPGPDVAFVHGDRPGERITTTWAQVMEARRKRQAQRLELIRRSQPWQAYRVWVAYYDMTLMGGWQAFIENHRTMHYYGGWIDRDRRWLKPLLMQTFPLILPLGSEAEQWALWKTAFARQYQRGTHDGRPRGSAFVWWNGRQDPPRTVSARLGPKTRF